MGRVLQRSRSEAQAYRLLVAYYVVLAPVTRPPLPTYTALVSLL